MANARRRDDTRVKRISRTKIELLLILCVELTTSAFHSFAVHFFSTCFVRLETERALFLFLLSHLLVVARRIIIMYYDYDIIALATQCRDQIPQFECRFVGMATENTNQKLNRNGTTKKIRTKREPKQLVRAASFCLVVTLNKNGNE